ncbi:MAG: GNAT family N-acetyltransferase [Chloroflexi bacterium]|nr:GNAT family N-acetyltransferase [Chloroflexota bacterium]
MSDLPEYLSGFPKQLTVRDGRTVTLRPMTADDGDALLAMFWRLGVGDRFFLRDDVVDPAVIRRWTEELDYDHVLPILAVTDSGAVMADATLHRSHHPARAHVAEIRYTVNPEFRYQGLGGRLIHELLDIAYHVGVRKVMLELVAIGEDSAIRAAERSGFRQLVRLLNQVQYREGMPFDLILLERNLENWSEVHRVLE